MKRWIMLLEVSAIVEAEDATTARVLAERAMEEVAGAYRRVLALHAIDYTDGPPEELTDEDAALLLAPVVERRG